MFLPVSKPLFARRCVGELNCSLKRMKTIMIIIWLTASMLANADEKVAVNAVSGRFEVAQEYRGDFVETVRFLSPELPSIVLLGFSWPGLYHISPDEHCLLRTQKTGSGDNVAILYRIEENGRVSEVLGFNDTLWTASDTASRLKKKELYHTGVSEVKWAADSGSLEIILSGSNAAKTGDRIEIKLVYDLKGNKVVNKDKTSETRRDNPYQPFSSDDSP